MKHGLLVCCPNHWSTFTFPQYHVWHFWPLLTLSENTEKVSTNILISTCLLFIFRSLFFSFYVMGQTVSRNWAFDICRPDVCWNRIYCSDSGSEAELCANEECLLKAQIVMMSLPNLVTILVLGWILLDEQYGWRLIVEGIVRMFQAGPDEGDNELQDMEQQQGLQGDQNQAKHQVHLT